MYPPAYRFLHLSPKTPITMKIHRILFPIFIILFLPALFSKLHAQTYTMGHEEFMSWEDFVSEFFDEMKEYGQEETQIAVPEEIMERLEELHHHPLNINLAKRDELQQLPFLGEAQIDSILKYREQKHLFRSLGELQWVNGIPYEPRCRLSLFTFAGDTIAAATPILSKFYKGRHELVSRMDIPLYERAGDKSYTHEELQHNPNRIYLGNRLANTTRYRYRWRQDIAYGLTLQKDAGEPFAKEKNYPYDYASLYFYFRPERETYALWVGDYNLHFGQGILFGHSFFNSPLQTIENGTFSRSRIRPHTSSDEINYFRGAAAMVRLGRYTQLSAFASYRKLDGRMEGDTLTSFKTDGLHRTQRELERRNAIGNGVVGSHLTYKKEKGHIGATLYWSFYNKTIYPPLRNYNRYYLRGKSAGGLSTDYSWHSQQLTLFGETAIDKEGNIATTNTMNYAFNNNFSLLLQERSFSNRFVSPFGNTLEENSRIQNEHAVLLGTTFLPFNKTKVTAYAEYFYHPRPTFRTDLPSHGMQVYVQTKFMATKKWTFALRYKMKTEEQNVSGYHNFMQYVGTHRLRLTSYFNSQRFNLNMAGDFTAATRQTSATTLGWMFSSRGRLLLNPHFSAHLFGSVFFTDDYASRLYAYEPQLQYAASFPTFAYHGTRLAGMLQWKFCKDAYVAMRYGWLHYFNRDHISSGIQEIASSSKNDLSVQLGWKF